MGLGDNVNIMAPNTTNKNQVSFRYDHGSSQLNITMIATVTFTTLVFWVDLFAFDFLFFDKLWIEQDLPEWKAGSKACNLLSC